MLGPDNSLETTESIKQHGPAQRIIIAIAINVPSSIIMLVSSKSCGTGGTSYSENSEKPQNREYIDIIFDDMDHIDNDAVPRALATRQGAEALIPPLRERFASFQNDTFRNMMWLDPQF